MQDFIKVTAGSSFSWINLANVQELQQNAEGKTRVHFTSGDMLIVGEEPDRILRAAAVADMSHLRSSRCCQ